MRTREPPSLTPTEEALLERVRRTGRSATLEEKVVTIRSLDELQGFEAEILRRQEMTPHVRIAIDRLRQRLEAARG